MFCFEGPVIIASCKQAQQLVYFHNQSQTYRQYAVTGQGQIQGHFKVFAPVCIDLHVILHVIAGTHPFTIEIRVQFMHTCMSAVFARALGPGDKPSLSGSNVRVRVTLGPLGLG